MTIRKAIQWLEMYANRPVKWDNYSDESREVREEAEKQIAEAFRMAVDVLKEQEPRVMTLSNLRDIGLVWELNTPPCLWMDIKPSYRWTRGFWVVWREIYNMIDGLHPTYDADNYGKTWRCWTSRPTDEQREAVKWE